MRIVCFVLALVIGAAAWDISNRASLPLASSIAGYQELGVGDKLLINVFVSTSGWNIKQFVIFRVATTSLSGEEIKFVQVPFSGGTWYKI